MNDYSVNTDSLFASVNRLDEIFRRLRIISGDIYDVKYAIDFRTRSRYGLDRSLDAAVENAESCAEKARLMMHTLSDIGVKYVRTEDELMQRNTPIFKRMDFSFDYMW